jgi:hypothetical protein
VCCPVGSAESYHFGVSHTGESLGVNL